MIPDNAMVVAISTKKFTEITTFINVAKLLPQASIKNKQFPIINTAELIIGVTNETTITPIKRRSFFIAQNALKIKPQNKPARPVFNRQSKTVITGLIAMNPETSTANKHMTPSTRPSHKPATGPNKHAPKTMANNATLIDSAVILRVPRKFERNPKTTTNAVNIPRLAIYLIFLEVFILLTSIL